MSLPREWTEVPESDYIFHLAAYGNRYEQQDEQEIFDSNIILLWRLLQATKDMKYSAFINFSSSSTLLDYETFYSATKAAGERICRAFVNKYNKPIVSVRPYSVYGGGDWEGHFIPTAIKAFKEDLELNVAPGEHDWIHVSDLVAGVMKVTEASNKLKGQCINIGTGFAQSNYAIISILQDIFLKHGNVKRIGQIREYDTKRWQADNSVLLGLGWEPKIELEDGLEALVYDTK